jgi:hypothetical protein
MNLCGVADQQRRRVFRNAGKQYSTYRLGAFLGSETASVKAADLARTAQKRSDSKGSPEKPGCRTYQAASEPKDPVGLWNRHSDSARYECYLLSRQGVIE